MTYLATYTEPNAAPVVIGEYLTLSDARTACREHLSEVWDNAMGTARLKDVDYAYDRGQFAQWGGASRLYVILPSGATAHYDIAERTW